MEKWLANWRSRMTTAAVKRYGWKVALPLVALIVGVVLLVETWVADWLTYQAWPHIKRGLVGFSETQIGWAGAAFFMMLLALTLFAFVETSPLVPTLREWISRTGGAKVAPSPPLSREEREDIHQLRVLWEKGGSEAAYKMRYMFENVLEEAHAHLWWSDLLDQFAKRLQWTEAEMDRVIDDRREVALEDVVVAFNLFWDAYVKVAGRLHLLCHHEQVSLMEGPHASRYRRWEGWNRVFISNLDALSVWPNFHGILSSSVGGNVAAHLFLTHIHFPDDSLPSVARISAPSEASTQSTLDTEVRSDPAPEEERPET